MCIRDRWLAKARTGPASVLEDDDPSVWTGVLPVRTVLGTPAPTAEAAARGIRLPASIEQRLATGR